MVNPGVAPLQGEFVLNGVHSQLDEAAITADLCRSPVFSCAQVSIRIHRIPASSAAKEKGLAHSTSLVVSTTKEVALQAMLVGSFLIGFAFCRVRANQNSQSLMHCATAAGTT